MIYTVIALFIVIAIIVALILVPLSVSLTAFATCVAVNILDAFTNLPHILIFILSISLFLAFLYVRGMIAIKNNWKKIGAKQNGN